MKNVWHETTINPPRHLISNCDIEYCGQACTMLHTVPTEHATVDCGEWCGCRVVDPPQSIGPLEPQGAGWADKTRSLYLDLRRAGFPEYQACSIIGHMLAGRTKGVDDL